jgi:ATP-dependent DNA helicase PIF1
MRLNKNDKQYAKYLLTLGNGTLPYVEDDIGREKNLILLDKKMVLPTDTDDLFNFVYPNLQDNYSDITYLNDRVILAPTNAEVTTINNKIIEQFPGEAIEYLAADSTVDEGNARAGDLLQVPVEYLNSLNPAGFPPFSLTLKVNAPCILMRNLNANKGLCNGTRVQLLEHLSPRLLKVKILGGTHKGNIELIPRINLKPQVTDFPFLWTRRQFPLVPAFALTINKSQGQSINTVGVYLENPCFAHGQLYVAMGRVTSSTNIRVALLDADKALTTNIVHRCVLVD